MTEQFPDQRPDQPPQGRRRGAPPWIRVVVLMAVFVAVFACMYFGGSHRLEYSLGVVVAGALVLGITAGVMAARRSGSQQAANMSYGHPRQGRPVPSGYAMPADGQPGYGMPGYAPPGPPPPTYLAWRIIASICGLLFNLILGLPAALIGGRYGNKAAELWASGDEQAAASASRKARGWLITATVLDAIGLLLVIVLLTQALSPQPDFNNPSVVAASIKSQLQQLLNGQSYEPGVTVTSVVCTPSGTSTDHCLATLSSGQTFATTAVILENGKGFRTNGFRTP